MSRCLLLCLLLTTPALAAAAIYRYEDAQGNPVFTDEPPPGVSARPVDLPPPTTVEMAVPAPTAASPAAEPPATTPYQTLAIGGLPEGEAVRANDGDLRVQAILEPPLRPGHRLRLLLDGRPQPDLEPQTMTAQLDNLDRGQHNLQLEVLAEDRVVQRSAVRTFTVQRVHTSSPARP